MSDSVMVDGVEFRPYPPNPRYKVSADGRVIGMKGRVLSLLNHGAGYKTVGISWPDGKQNTRTVHRMVLETFVGPAPANAPLARHLNGDPADNRVENLAWGTQSENMLDMVEHGRCYNAEKTHCVHGHEYTPENTYNVRSCRNSPNRGRMCKACCARRYRESREKRGLAA